MRATLDAHWEFFSESVAQLWSGWSGSEKSRQLAALIRECVTPETIRASIDMFSDVDVSALLPKVSVPTLVIHPRQAPYPGLDTARDLASGIPGARLTAIGGNWANYDDEAALAVIDEFLSEGEPAATSAPIPTPSGLRTVLFTDLVGHTEMMSRLGDERGRAVLREHERITREVLRAHGGTEVKTMGDGFMASFGSVTKAVECGIALQRAVDARNMELGTGNMGERLEVRCGLNAGEPIAEDGDLFGATVILAARVAAKAEGGEILVANAVRELCSGKGFLFSDRGEFVAKGFEEPVRVYEVRWRE